MKEEAEEEVEEEARSKGFNRREWKRKVSIVSSAAAPTVSRCVREKQCRRRAFVHKIPQLPWPQAIKRANDRKLPKLASMLTPMRVCSQTEKIIAQYVDARLAYRSMDRI